MLEEELMELSKTAKKMHCKNNTWEGQGGREGMFVRKFLKNQLKISTSDY